MTKKSISTASWGALAAGAVLVAGALVGTSVIHDHAVRGSEQLTFANSYNLNHHHNACGTALVQQQLVASDSELQLTVFPSSQLGGDAERVASLLDGDIDIDLQGSSALASVYEPIGVMDMAYVFDNPDHLFEWFDSEASQQVKDDFEEATGAKILGVWYLGDRTFSANAPVRTPEDLQGLRLRYPETPAHLASAAAVGAEPVAVAFEEVYLSLQQGLVDGQENPISLTAENSLDEVVDYVSLSRHAVGSQLIIVAGDTWERLSEQEQADLQAAISDVRAQNRQCADEDEQETMTRWKEQGTPEIIEDVDREAFMEKAHAYWEENLSPEELEVYNSIRSVK
ncbi:sialic acid TRAP transporter substrate-binding protein SiaP [Corynebacterium stationis]|jgi:tripartite ATP-independent transporter DctP family solute receptor|uniref:tRNA modification GTPase n=2 Tax=Corynebacterium stationis TaxID=1705 RepID=A0A0X8VDU5_9CORY|nr:sialic acid TRAP transporter substrate-binding protein SiaP [Corynebacterium stationis]AMJ44072.1 tRNA modification GTPase [Corynebacterium stationis]APT94409.1 tRNA modification GTPase [Corynebacterium stationis]AQX70530.1 tRNA modification GTPase [Corynebacterium stationis]ASJ18222.1 tRNA modification GTPase [Corynebacterium stationis]OAH26074.1 tRNA modification GTPase [Corynebacterium stationis]